MQTDYSKGETTADGTNGFYLFGDSSLQMLGSSGGKGGYTVMYTSQSLPSSGGIGAGRGGSSPTINDSVMSAGSGTAATMYGCGGGGAGFATNTKQTTSKLGSSGEGKQGAVFFRFYF